MTELPNLDLTVIGSLFAIVLTALFASWSINKAIYIIKTH